MKSPALERYRKRMLHGPWRLEGCTEKGFGGVVVIPACAERASLPRTLSSLATNPAAPLDDWLVVVVLNQPAAAAAADHAENIASLDWLRSGGATGIANLAWVDAISEESQLPAKDAGVGLARKLGFDLALERLQDERALLASLDADTLVEPGYLQALTSHFERATAGGATLPFCHQPADTPEQQAAIDRYELYLRHYVFGLQLAGSPYAYHSIGSALACRASAYLAAGGMNRRKAGEDFYFLQQLAKSGGVDRLQGTCVRPSSRCSHRVPFGTGEKVARLLGGEDAVRFHPPAAFSGLQQLLAGVDRNPLLAAEARLRQLDETMPAITTFLRRENFIQTWDKLSAQHRTPAALTRAFHGWFDALKSWRLIRYLSDRMPATDPGRAPRELLLLGGQRDDTGLTVLEHLRALQGSTPTGATPQQNYAMLSPDPARGPGVT